MGVFEMIVLVVALGCATGVITSWLEARGKTTPEDVDKRIDERLNEVDELRRRVETLEKIVTDSSYELKEQIRRL